VKTYYVTRTLPAAGNTIHIGVLNHSGGGAGYCELQCVVNNGGGNSIAKKYLIPLKFNNTGGVWQNLLPIASTGAYSGNDFKIEMKNSSTRDTIRVRTVSGTTGGTLLITLAMYPYQGSTSTFVETTTAETSPTAVTATFSQMPWSAEGNLAGINTLNPLAALHVTGTGATSSTYALRVQNSSATELFNVRNDGLCAIGGTPVTGFPLYVAGATRTDGLGLFRGAGSATGSTTAAGVRLYNTSSTETYNIAAKDGGGAAIYDNGGAEAWTMTAAGLIGMGDTSPEEKLDVDGNVKALHYIGQSTAPGVVKGADNVVGTAASGSTVSLSGTDAGFEVTLTTGSAGISTTGDLFTVTFNAAYGAAPVVVYSASNAAAGSYPLTGYTYSTATTTTVVITNAVANLTDETDYKWSFVVMGK
jgi:hypothetical protein